MGARWLGKNGHILLAALALLSGTFFFIDCTAGQTYEANTAPIGRNSLVVKVPQGILGAGEKEISVWFGHWHFCAMGDKTVRWCPFEICETTQEEMECHGFDKATKGESAISRARVSGGFTWATAILCILLVPAYFMGGDDRDSAFVLVVIQAGVCFLALVSFSVSCSAFTIVAKEIDKQAVRAVESGYEGTTARHSWGAGLVLVFLGWLITIAATGISTFWMCTKEKKGGTRGEKGGFFRFGGKGADHQNRHTLSTPQGGTIFHAAQQQPQFQPAHWQGSPSAQPGQFVPTSPPQPACAPPVSPPSSGVVTGVINNDKFQMNDRPDLKPAMPTSPPSDDVLGDLPPSPSKGNHGGDKAAAVAHAHMAWHPSSRMGHHKTGHMLGGHANPVQDPFNYGKPVAPGAEGMPDLPMGILVEKE